MIYLVFGLSGPMKKMFTDVLRNNLVFHMMDSEKDDEAIKTLEAAHKYHLFNIKGVTRDQKYYDDGLLLYFMTDISMVETTKTPKKKLFEKKELFKEEFSYSVIDLNGGSTCYYAINMKQIEIAQREERNHFVICNDIYILKKLIDKLGKDAKIINFEIKDSILQTCFEKINQRYEQVGIITTGDILKDRIIKAKKIIGNENRIKIEQIFHELRTAKTLLDIEIKLSDDENVDIQRFKNDLLEIIDKDTVRFDWVRLLTNRKIFDEIDNKKEKIFMQNEIITNNNIKKKQDNIDSLLDPFISDYQNISALSAFRRMQDKCQVFPLKRYDYARTRLTHSIEVAAVAEALGETAVRLIRERKESDYSRVCRAIPIILRNAALLHDMGNPPFGHFSEDAIRLWFENNKQHIFFRTDDTACFDEAKSDYCKACQLPTELAADLLFYEGNAQLLRLLTTLADLRGMKNLKDNNYDDIFLSPNLTMATIATTIKYPTSSEVLSARKYELSVNNKKEENICLKKNGYFESESIYFHSIDKELGLKEKRHPLTFLLEAADDIAYCASDIEDALKRKLLTLNDIINEVNTLLLKENYAIESKKQVLIQLRDGIYRHINAMETITQNTNIVAIELAYKSLRNLIKDIMINHVKTAFANNYDRIMKCDESSFKGELLEVSDASLVVKLIKNILIKYVYRSNELIKNQIKASQVLNTIIRAFVKAAVNIGYETNEAKTSNNNNIIDKNIFDIFSENYRIVCQQKNEKIDFKLKSIQGKTDKGKDKLQVEKVYYCLLLAMDVFSGMTDSYAMEIYHLLMASK